MRKILLAPAMVFLASTSLWATDDLGIPEASSSLSSSSSSSSSAAVVQPLINDGLDLFVYTSKVSDKEKLRQRQTYPKCEVDEYYSVPHDTKIDILEYLSITSLENMSKVSKGWRALVLGHATSFPQISFIEGKTDPKLVALNQRAIALHKGINVAQEAPGAAPAGNPPELFDPVMGLRHLLNDGQIYVTEGSPEHRKLVDDLMARARLGNMDAAVLVLQLTRPATEQWRLNMPLLRFIRDKTKPKTADEIRDFNYNLATCALIDQIQRRASGGKIYNRYDSAKPTSLDTTLLDRDTYLRFIQMLKTVDDLYFGNVPRLLHFSSVIAAGRYKLTDAIEKKTMGPAMIETVTKVRSRDRKIEDLRIAYEANQFVRKNYGIPFLPGVANFAIGFGYINDWGNYLEIENPRFGIDVLIKNHLDSVPN